MGNRLKTDAWAIGTCRVAMMSFGKGDRGALNGLFSASWKEVGIQMEQVLGCTKPPQQQEKREMGGGWMAFTSA